MTQLCDLLIVGSGPAGMSAAINGASEGLKVCMLDGNTFLGGQARESNAIENYPGFPEGITGADLMNRFTDQATKFHTAIHAPVRAVKLRREDDGTLVVTSEDYMEFRSKTVLLSLGLSYRRLDTEGVSKYMGRGVYYGLPGGVFHPHKKKCGVVVVGGANSAGQAVMHLARNKDLHITMLIRRKIEDQMSTYLIERIRQFPNVEVKEGVEVRACDGNSTHLECAHLSDGTTVKASAMFIFIGAVPKTAWLEGVIEMDDKKFIKTWDDLDLHGKHKGVMPFETTVRGVFAAGDVRRGSVKRIAAAIGEGGHALQMIHNRLATLQ